MDYLEVDLVVPVPPSKWEIAIRKTWWRELKRRRPKKFNKSKERQEWKFLKKKEVLEIERKWNGENYRSRDTIFEW
jgi:hypothetical protein